MGRATPAKGETRVLRGDSDRLCSATQRLSEHMTAVQRVNTTALTVIALTGLKRASESLDGNKASD